MAGGCYLRNAKFADDKIVTLRTTQSAADALLAITVKVGQFRGESRFTTWAYKFVIFEVSAKIGRHFWRHPVVPLGAEQWERLPARFGFDARRKLRAALAANGYLPDDSARGS